MNIETQIRELCKRSSETPTPYYIKIK